MEKKILHTFRVLNSLFFEAKFVYKTPPRGAEDETKTDSDEKDKDGKLKEAEKKEVGKKVVEEKVETKEESVKERSTERRETLRETEKLPKRKPRRGAEVDTEEQRKEKEKDEKAKKKFEESIEIKLSTKNFLEKDMSEQTNKLDWLRINRTRQDIKLNAQVWDHSTPEGLDKIKKDFVDLGIMNNPKDAEYYGTMFAVLYRAADEGNPYRSENDGAYIASFKNPTDEKSRADISGMVAKKNFLGGEVYLKAFDSLTQVRARLMVQDTSERTTRETQSKQGVDPIAATATDFVKNNITVLQEAAKKGDYATLGIYAVGAYALWKTVGAKLFGGGGHDAHGGGHGAHGGGFDIKTWAMWGAALYGADKLLKNAGYDVLKMAGFKDMNSEVKGTPMESMQNILSQSSVANETKDLDYGIVLKMSETKLVDLDRFMKSAKTSGVDKFIHPREFPDLFPDVKNAWPFKSQDINKPDGATEREYAKIGKQLYKLALALPVVYEKTLLKDHPKYTGLTYEKMLTDPVRSDLRVWELLEAARQYAPESVGSGFLSGRKPQEIEAKMLAGTDKVLENNGFTLDKTTELKPGTGHIAGHLKGFPIVVVAVKEGYRVYLQSDYNDKLGYNATPGTKFKFIPLEGGKAGAEEAVKRVDKRMEELMKSLKEKNKDISGLTYESGQWKAKIDFAGAEDLGVAEKKGVSVNVNVDELGQSLRLDGESSREKSLEKDVLNRILAQDEFKALSVFSNAKQLKVENGKEGDGKVTLVVGNSKTKFDVKFNGDFVSLTSGKFSVEGGSTVEKAFIQNPSFAQDYIDALDGDKEFELNKNIGNLQELMSKSAPEGFVKHFFEALTQQTNKSAVSGFNLDTLSGSIPENFTSMVLATSKNEVLQRLRKSILSASTFAEVENARKEILQDFNDKIKAISKTVADENIKLEKEGKKWDRDVFMSRVVDRVRKASCVSTTYSGAKADFENMVYKLPLPGFLTKKSDLSNTSHEAAAQLMGVYVYYTAHLDNNKDINLDRLTYPPTPTAGVLDHTKDPALRGHFAVRYFEYVKNQIYNKANAMGDLSSIPSPTAVDVWQIKEFDVWMNTEGDYSPLDSLDNSPAFKHDPEIAHVPDASGKIRATELEIATVKEFDDAVNILREAYPTELNFHAIDAYLRLKAKDAGPDDAVGLFRVQVDPVTHKERSQLWDWSESIGKLPRRSQQVAQIQDLVDKFLIRHIFENPSQFFTKKISIGTRVLKSWPWLRDIPLVPDWINPFN